MPIYEMWSRGENKEALAAATKFVSRWPNNAAGWSILSGIYSNLGRYEEARRAMRRCYKLKPSPSLKEMIEDDRFWRPPDKKKE